MEALDSINTNNSLNHKEKCPSEEINQKQLTNQDDDDVEAESVAEETDIAADVAGPYKIGCLDVPYWLWVFVNYVLISSAALVGHILDIVSDIVVAIRHYEDGNKWWCGLTIGFVFLPSLLFASYTLNRVLRTENGILKKILSSILYIVSTTVLFLLPICRLVHIVKYAIYALLDKQNGVHYIKIIKRLKGNDAILQSVLKAFLESAPQLLLQLYIMMDRALEEQSNYTIAAQIVSVVISLISLTCNVTALEMKKEFAKAEQCYQTESGIQRSDIKRDNPVKNYRICCATLEFIWRFCAISARMIALALFASVFSYWVYLVGAIHMTVVVMCLFLVQTKKSFETFLVTLFLGFMYTFCFVQYKVNLDKIAKMVSLYVMYYSFTFIQNTTMVILAYVKAPIRFNFHLPLLIVHFCAFTIGVVFMVLYHGGRKALQLKTLQSCKEMQCVNT